MIGLDIIDFTDENGFEVINDLLPTNHSQMENDGMHDREITPDLTLFNSETVKAEEWKRQKPIEKCHHDVLQYKVSFKENTNLLNPRERKYPKKTTVSWRKVHWGNII
eukprot:11775944-Ditylum_brightwellii.AAC.1